MRFVTALLCFAACAAPVQAAESAWQEVFPEVQMRLIASNAVQAHGTTWIGLEIDMPSNMKTYWRVPGETGIPPRFDFSGSNGISDHVVAWPMPLRETDSGYLDHVYYGHTILPLELTLDGEPVALDVDVVLGVCSDICVPVAAKFEVMLDLAQPDRASTLRIDQARARVPLAWDGAEPPFGDASFDPVARTLAVEVAPVADISDPVLADIEGSMALFGEPEHTPDGDALVFPLLGGKKMIFEDGMALHLTFDTPEGPFEIVRPLHVSPTNI